MLRFLCPSSHLLSTTTRLSISTRISLPALYSHSKRGIPVLVRPFSIQSSSSYPTPSTTTTTPPPYGPDVVFHALALQSFQRGNRESSSIFLSCVFGGVLLSFGCACFVMISGGSPTLQKENPGLHKLLGGLVFPIGLGMILLNGGELVTSNFFLCSLPILSPQSIIPGSTGNGTLSNAFRIWSASLAGNAIGSVVVAFACSDLLFSSELHSNWVAALAETKCRLGPGVVLIKAIGANFLVNVAVLSSASATTPGAKLAALWGPICVFVVLGLEHSVANMFLIPLGIFRGAKVKPEEAITMNIIPAVIGNLLGALLLVQLKVNPAQYATVASKLFVK